MRMAVTSGARQGVDQGADGTLTAAGLAAAKASTAAGLAVVGGVASAVSSQLRRRTCAAHSARAGGDERSRAGAQVGAVDRGSAGSLWTRTCGVDIYLIILSYLIAGGSLFNPHPTPPPPRSRAAKAVARNHTMVRSNSQANRSDAVAALLNPTTGIRDEQKRKGFKPHDHTRDNKQYIKQLQQMNRTREEVAAVEASTPRKVSSKYKDVSSRVMTPRQLDRPSTAPAARPSSARPPLEPRNFMAGRPAWQANQPFATGWKQPAPQSTLAPAAAEKLSQRCKTKAPVPKQDLTPRALGSSSSGTNFLQRNVSAASLAPRRSAAPGPPSEDRKHEHHGALPPYLLDRKLAHAAAVAAKEESLARQHGQS